MRKSAHRSSNDRKGSCRALIETAASTAAVDCSGCPIAPDLFNPECFLGIARGLVPGFSGEIVLKGRMDRSYSGPVVEAVSSASEVLDMLDALKEQATGTGLDLVRRSRFGRCIGRIVKAFEEDPVGFLEKQEALREELSSLSGGSESAAVKRLDDITERTGLMVRKLKAHTEAR